jgi:hypothetical protein
MSNGNANFGFQSPWLLHGEMAAAIWANWCLLSLQMMHGVNQACLKLAVGSCAGGMTAARALYESASTGNSSSNG